MEASSGAFHDNTFSERRLIGAKKMSVINEHLGQLEWKKNMQRVVFLLGTIVLF